MVLYFTLLYVIINLNFIIMRKIFIILSLVIAQGAVASSITNVVTMVDVKNTTIKEAEVKIDVVVDINDIEFSILGDIVSYDFNSAFCTETRNGITYSTTVSCFWCSDDRSAEKCARILAGRLDDLRPAITL